MKSNELEEELEQLATPKGEEEKSIFISYTGKDKELLKRFDEVVASVEIKRHRANLEKIDKPEWLSIRDNIRKSRAFFLLVGKELVRFQGSEDPEIIKEWRYTQNWIAFEIGVACEREMDVWVLCDDVTINFPVPYLNNYFPMGLGEGKTEAFDFFVEVLKNYEKGFSYPCHPDFGLVECISCGAMFNLRLDVPSGDSIICPQCLQELILTD